MSMVECEIGPAWPSTHDWEELAAEAAHALATLAPELANPRLSVSIVWTDDEEARALNHQWRGKDKPTNVLSFPMMEREDLLALKPAGPPELLGDIALAYETCAREAQEKGIAVTAHAAHLMVHGLLHLAGHDHEISEHDARAMEQLETKALALLGISDPYGPDY